MSRTARLNIRSTDSRKPGSRSGAFIISSPRSGGLPTWPELTTVAARPTTPPEEPFHRWVQRNMLELKAISPRIERRGPIARRHAIVYEKSGNPCHLSQFCAQRIAAIPEMRDIARRHRPAQSGRRTAPIMLGA